MSSWVILTTLSPEYHLSGPPFSNIVKPCRDPQEMKRAGMETLGVTCGVGSGFTLLNPWLPQKLLEMLWFAHYTQGSHSAHAFSQDNWADSTQRKRKGVTGGRRNLQ